MTMLSVSADSVVWHKDSIGTGNRCDVGVDGVVAPVDTAIPAIDPCL